MKEGKETRIFKTASELFSEALKLWAVMAEEFIEQHGSFAVAISGGKTPGPFYERLSGMTELPWEKTHVFMVDERFVPYDDEANNYRMINQILLMNLHIPATNIHPILTSQLFPAESAEKYEKNVRAFFKSRRRSDPVFDLILLGIGSDGHTASLFPGSAALQERERYVTEVKGDNGPERITMTLPLINMARNITFLVTGAEKAGAVRDVIQNRRPDLPASMVNPAKGKVYYLIDKEAASLLR
jgi:6-phosphogluconolactonase